MTTMTGATNDECARRPGIHRTLRRRAAADLALFFVGAPENEMLLSLHQVRTNLEADLAEPFGAEAATLVAQAFVATVVRHRREIEAAGMVRRLDDRRKQFI
jgi:hypothetical protein